MFDLLLRKALHSSGALILVIQAYSGLLTAQLVIISMTILYTVSEYLRLKGSGLPLFATITLSASTIEEKKRVVTAPIWFAIGTLASITLFPFKYAIVGVLTLTIGDSVASLVGQFIKKKHSYRFNRSKSIEGSIAGFIAATLVCSLFLSPFISIIGCISGMIIEALPTPLNDNLTVPILSSLTSFMLGICLIN